MKRIILAALVKTTRGGAWYAATVKNVIKRVA